MVVEDDVLDADAAAGLLRLGAAPRGQRAAAFRLVAGVAVGDRDEADADGPARPTWRRRRPRRWSQSSGCAPKAMMLSLPSVLGA